MFQAWENGITKSAYQLFTLSAIWWQIYIFTSRHKHESLSAWKYAGQCRYIMCKTPKYRYDALFIPITRTDGPVYRFRFFYFCTVSFSFWQADEQEILKCKLRFNRSTVFEGDIPRPGCRWMFRTQCCMGSADTKSWKTPECCTGIGARMSHRK